MYSAEITANSKVQIDLNQIDIYTKKSFHTLIEANKGLPYFVVSWNKEPYFADAIKYLHRKKGDFDPQVSSFKIYKIWNDFVEFFCDEKTLRKDHDYCAIFMDACNLAISPSLRAPSRLRLAVDYEEKSELEEAKHWLDLAMEDGSTDARLIFAGWFSTGNKLVKQSEQEAINQIKVVVHQLRDDDPDARKIIEMYLRIITDEPSLFRKEIEYCEKRLDAFGKKFVD